MSNYSTDYHDYVIKDGKLVGKFEEMYQHSNDIPWRQDQQESWIDVRMTLELMHRKNNYQAVIDYGCGLGNYLDILCRRLNIAKGFGFDISETAVLKAGKAFPNYCFKQADLTSSSVEGFRVDEVHSSRLHVIRGTLWYVFPHLNTVVENILGNMTDSDSLLIIQNFPNLESEFVGKEVLPNYESIITHFTNEERLKVESKIWYEQFQNNKNDSWFIGLFIK